MRLLALVAFIALVAKPARAVRIFAEGSQSTIDKKAQGWHRDYEHEADYNESWFYLVQTEEGGVLFAMMFVSNLGLHTFDAGYDVAYYAPDGRKLTCHKEHRRSAIRAADEGMDLAIGRSRTWRDARGFHLGVDDDCLRMNLTLVPELPPQQFGDGHMVFDDGKLWANGMNAPRARARGKIEGEGITASLAGTGYHDHNWTTIKVPSMLDTWRTLRVFAKDLTLVLHEQRLKPRYGGHPVRFGVLARGGEVVAKLRDFSYTEVRAKLDQKSGYRYPVELELSLDTGGYRIRGRIRERRQLASVDVLAEISWPVRALVRAFYSKPFTLRYLGDYELEVKDPTGSVTHLNGTAPMEANFY